MCNRRARYKIQVFRHIFRIYRSRAGCIVLKTDLDGKISVLLIQALGSTKKGKTIYKLAAGGVEKGEARERAAARETEEEAGVIGQAADYLGEHRPTKRMTHTYFYLMDDGYQLLPKDKYEERIAGRERKRVKEDEAIQTVPNDQKEFLLRGLTIYKAKHKIATK